MIKYEEIIVTPEIWEVIEKSLSPWSNVKLKIDSDEIILKLHKNHKSYKYSIGVFINSVMKGAETEENQKKYWRVKQKAVFSGAKKKEIFKVFGKKNALKKFPRLNQKLTFYLPYFETFGQLKSKYKTLKATWLKPVYEDLSVNA